jgi:Ca2+-binding RTX toxin-like protein
VTRTLWNATNDGLLTQNSVQGNSLDIIDLANVSDTQHATALSKFTLNKSFNATDHGSSLMESFGARDGGRHERSDGDRPFSFERNSKAAVTESVDSSQGSGSLASDGQSATSTVKSAPTLNTDSDVAVPVAAKAAVSSPSTVETVSVSAAASAAKATGFPDATNTGVPAGTKMTTHNGGLTVTADNTVISNMVINGPVVINADNVTFKNVQIVTSGFYAVRVMGDAKNFTMQDSEVDGLGTTATAIQGNGTFLRNNIHGAENGIDVPNGDQPTLIQDNYIHGLLNTNGAPHYDGIQIDGAHDVKVVHNTVVNEHGQTSAIMMDNYWEGLSNIVIDNNRLWGGGYTVYLDDTFDGGAVLDDTIQISNNEVGGGGYGSWSLYGNNPKFSGNTTITTKPTDSNGGGTVTLPEKPITPETPVTPEIPVTPETPVSHAATQGNDVLTGTAGVDKIDGLAGNDTIKGLDGNDILTGGAGADKLDGGTGIDTVSYATAKSNVTASLANPSINGGDAKGDTYVSIEQLTGSSYIDKLYGNDGANLLTGGAGNDALHGGAGADKLDGGTGTDTANYGDAKTGVTASLGNTSINTGDAKGDIYVSIEYLTGSSYADKLYGDSGSNLLTGGSGNDVLNGGGGNDVLFGGAGADDLVGGAGADTFVFKALDDTTVSSVGRDTIFDFSGTAGDRIDVSAIDANTATSGDQAFTYVGTAAFTGKAGELRYVKGASDTYVYGDVNGDARADFAIHLDDAVSLSKGYFVL